MNNYRKYCAFDNHFCSYAPALPSSRQESAFAPPPWKNSMKVFPVIGGFFSMWRALFLLLGIIFLLLGAIISLCRVFFRLKLCPNFSASVHAFASRVVPMLSWGNFRKIARLLSVQCYYMYNNADKIN